MDTFSPLTNISYYYANDVHELVTYLICEGDKDHTHKIVTKDNDKNRFRQCYDLSCPNATYNLQQYHLYPDTKELRNVYYDTETHMLVDANYAPIFQKDTDVMGGIEFCCNNIRYHIKPIPPKIKSLDDFNIF